MADPPLRRSGRRVPVRGAGRGRGRGGAVRRRPVRRRGRVLEPSRRDLHLRHHGRGVRASRTRAAAASGDDRARRRYGTASTWRRRRRGCWPPRWACRACTPTISPSSRPAWRSTTRSIAGAGTPRKRSTIGRPRRRRPEMASTVVDARPAGRRCAWLSVLRRGRAHLGADRCPVASAARPGRSR